VAHPGNFSADAIVYCYSKEYDWTMTGYVILHVRLFSFLTVDGHLQLVYEYLLECKENMLSLITKILVEET